MSRYSNKLPQSLWISPKEVVSRIMQSFVPRFQRTNVDLVGPVMALASLIMLLYYGQANKNSKATPPVSPTIAMFFYATIMPPMTYVLVHLGQGTIFLAEAVSITGYGLFGHVFTFLCSLALNDEASNTVFFCCMAVIGGFSALHVAIALLIVIPRPVARLIVCSVIATLQMLSLIFLHFTYMHTTFRYAHRS